MSQPIRIHPENSKLFEFRSKPLVLVTATEHYGSVINRPFNFAKYLADAADKHITLTRLFMLFREQQSYCNPYSTCKPESPDYISPFSRTGGGLAQDLQPKYNLDQWNPEFFERLHAFLTLASECGIIVEVTLLSNTYNDAIWALNPLNWQNNINGLPESRWQDYITLRHPQLFEYQAKHVRKIVEETCKYDNIIYEICNEPGGFNDPAGIDLPAPAEVDQWQMAIADVIRDAESCGPKHLIAAQEAFAYDPFTQPSMKSFRELDIDIVNIHPLPNTTYGSKSYDMGQFMMKQLNLRAVRDFCLATYNESKPLNLDEDNSSSQYKDVEGWTIHRKRAWTALMSGAHYDVIDFSIINYCETGTKESQKHIRSWMKHLSQFIHSLDVINARPLKNIVAQMPDHLCESVFGVENSDYAIYLADDRELADKPKGDRINGCLVVNIPEGTYLLSCYSPKTGQSSPAIKQESKGQLTCHLPPFAEDIVVRLRRC